MARIETAAHIEAPVEAVWDVLTDWESQPRWMHDAKAVVVTSPQRVGVGTVLRCPTNIALGLIIDDILEVTEWVEHRRVGVLHRGLVIRGVGAFELSPTPHGTHFVWWEEVAAPLGDFGDQLVSVFAVPYVTRIFRRSLANLKRVCESVAVRP